MEAAASWSTAGVSSKSSVRTSGGMPYVAYASALTAMNSRRPSSSSTTRTVTPSIGGASVSGVRQIISGTGSPKSSRPASSQARRRSSSSPLSRTLTVKPRDQTCEEGVGRGHERRAAQRVIRAKGAVGHNRDPCSAGAQHRPAALEQRTAAAPVRHRAVERDESAMAELCLGQRWRCSGSLRLPQYPSVKTAHKSHDAARGGRATGYNGNGQIWLS